jgi:hypothetical protein
MLARCAATISEALNFLERVPDVICSMVRKFGAGIWRVQSKRPVGAGQVFAGTLPVFSERRWAMRTCRRAIVVQEGQYKND